MGTLLSKLKELSLFYDTGEMIIGLYKVFRCIIILF